MYHVYVNDAWDKMLLSENVDVFELDEDEEYLLAISSDGDVEAVISYFPPALSE